MLQVAPYRVRVCPLKLTISNREADIGKVLHLRINVYSGQLLRCQSYEFCVLLRLMTTSVLQPNS